MSPNRGRVTTVLIQDRVRLFRESLRLVLDGVPGVGAVSVEADPDELERRFRSAPVDIVVLEVAGVTWDVRDLVGRLTRTDGGVRIVGTVPPGLRHAAVDGVRVVPRGASGGTFAAALRHGGDAPPVDAPAAAFRGPAEVRDLTPREVQVLALISGGLTTRGIAERLGISTKTVESRRQSLFAKLGVQSQSHAVSVGMRSGLIGHRPQAVGSGTGS